jgi:hypothetical protein
MDAVSASPESPRGDASSRLELGNRASDMATPEHIAQLTGQLSTLLTETVEHIAGLNREARILALNAEIESARAGDAGVAFGVVAKAMSQLSEKTGDSAKELARGSKGLIREMQQVTEVLQTKMRGERLSDMALTNIDLVDRNLYERSCDVRWWATDGSVVAALATPTEESRRFASQRLGVILNAYTVYFDLVLCDLDGLVVANGRPTRHAVLGMRQDQAPWFQAAMKTHSGDEFGFQSVHNSALVNQQRSLVYSCAVRAAVRRTVSPSACSESSSTGTRSARPSSTACRSRPTRSSGPSPASSIPRATYSLIFRPVRSGERSTTSFFPASGRATRAMACITSAAANMSPALRCRRASRPIPRLVVACNGGPGCGSGFSPGLISAVDLRPVPVRHT